MESYFLSEGCTGVSLDNETYDSMFNILMLLYADDTVLLANTPESLQKSLDVLSDYCAEWKLKVNVDKTKIIVFSKVKSRNVYSFSYQGKPVEVVEDFRYLGVLFNFNGSFVKYKKIFV
jgi:hypothetical protein